MISPFYSTQSTETPAMADPVIEVNQLEKTYQSGLFRKERVKALRDVSFQVQPGTIFGLLGPNGAGKTTLIKVLLGLVRKTAGEATMLGHPAGDIHSRMRAGYLPEHHRIPHHHTGNSAMAYYGGLSGMSSGEIRARRDTVLGQVGLGKWGQTSVKKYSKGMLQRLGLAQAMLHDPDLLILDEPTDGVDPVGRSEMRKLLREIQADGKTIFINSHLLQEVELICDKVAILVQGRLQRFGNVEDIKQQHQPDVEFLLAGPRQQIAQALSRATLLEVTTLSENRHRVQVQSPTQIEINHCIDQLRQQQIDIASISPLRTSLEDAFMNIVTRVEEVDPA